MVAPIKPKKVRALGKESFWLVPAVANVTAPTIVEINAATGINLSCTLLATVEGLTASFNKVTLPAYLCETEQFEANDVTSYSMTDLEGGFAPQATAASNDKKAFEFLRSGYTGFMVSRPGIVSDSATPDAVTGQFFNVVPVEITKAVPGKSGTDNSAIFTWKAGVSVTGPVGLIVAAT